MRMQRKWFFAIPVLIALFVFLGGEIVMHLWNWLLPPLFGWHMLTFWQAVGLLVLCRILFGGLSGGHRGGHGMRRHMRGRMGERWGERWEKMSPEERERFRQGMRGRCGFGEETAAPQA